MRNKVGDIWFEPWNKNGGFPVYIVTELKRDKVRLSLLKTFSTTPTEDDIEALEKTPKDAGKLYRRMVYDGIPHASFIEDKSVRLIVPWKVWQEHERQKKVSQ